MDEKTLYDKAVKQVATNLQLPVVEVNRIYKAYWKAVREYISSLPLKLDLSDEEFQNLRPNVNIPSIGKLYVTLDRYKRVKKHEEYRIQKIKEHAENKES